MLFRLTGVLFRLTNVFSSASQPRRSASHGSMARTLCIPFGSTDRLITTGNRQHGEINRSRHRHRLKKGLRWLTFSTDVSKLLIIGCFVCSHDRHHFLTLCQIYSITDKVQHSLQTRNLNLTATNEIRFADR